MNKSIVLALALATWTGCLDQGGDPSDGTEVGSTEQPIVTNTLERVFMVQGGVAMSTYQLAPNSGSFDNWGSLGGHDLTQLISEKNDDGRLIRFAIGGDQHVYGRYQTKVNGGWNPDGWGDMGGNGIVQLVTARDFNNRIELFARSTDGTVYRRYQVAANGGWNPEGWIAFGGYFPRELAAAQRRDGRIEVVAIGGDGHAYHKVQVTGGVWGTGDWIQVGGANLMHIAFGPDAFGNPYAFALDNNGSVWQAGPGGDTWTFQQLNSKTGLTQIAIGIEADNRLDVIAVGPTYDARVFELVQASPGGPFSTTFVPLVPGLYEANHARKISVTNDADGQISVFGFSDTGSTFRLVQYHLAWTAVSFIGGGVTNLFATQQPAS